MSLKDTLYRGLKRADSIVNYMTGLGTAGDRGQNSEIRSAAVLHDNRLEALWRSNAYAGVVVDELVREATRKGWTVQADEVAGDADPKDIMKDWDDDWATRREVAWAATLGRLMGGAALLIVTDDGKDPREEFDPEAPYQILNMVVLDKQEIFAEAYESDITKRGFGKPVLWRLQPSGNGVVEGSGLIVHTSRLVYFEGQRVTRRTRVEQRGFDDTILRRAMDPILNKTSIDQSRASIIQDFKTDVIRTRDLDAIGTADEQLDYFENRMELIARSKSNTNLVLLDSNEEFQKNTTSVAGLADLDRAAGDELTTAARMPRTRLMGEAPGGLNSDGESQNRNWNDQVASYQTDALRPALVRIYRVVLGAENGPTGGEIPESWSIVFNPLEEMTEQQTATVRKTVADADAIYLDRGVLDPEQVMEGRFGAEGWRMELPSLELEDLGEPEAGTTGPAPTDVQKSALNGAQVASLLAIVQAANEALISTEQAAQIVTRAFQVSPEEAFDLVSNPPTPNTPEVSE